jgi:glucan phosphoethanolaminetransferase (alkaline phosphatase superfamily)
MGKGYRSELHPLLLVLFAAVTYTVGLAVLTIVTAPAPNRWWIVQWSAPLALGASLSLFLIASFSRWVFFVLVNLCFFLAALAGYFIGQKGVILDHNTLAAVLETTAPEGSEFVANKLLFTVAVAVVLGLTVTVAYIRYYRHSPVGLSARAIIAALIVATIAFTVPKPLEASADVFLPAKLGISAYDYYLNTKKLDKQVRHQFDIATLPSSIDPSASGDFTIVLVIGESARADHLSLNGYHRHTNAYTEKESGLLNFSDVMSCDTATRISVPCLLTRATLEHKEVRTRETSLLALAKKHGFHTTWISMNDVYGKNNLPTSVIADSADEKIFRFGVNYKESNDLYLLPYLEKITHVHKSGRELIVVHLRGSHFNYAKRYPRDFAVFKPDTDCDDDRMCTINAYDNSILFTDYVLSRFIEDIKDREALLFYVADHGESLGETDQRGQLYWMHGQNERIEQRMVPMQVWASNRFIAKYPGRFAALARRTTSALSHDHFFHSVLDCIGIQSQVVEQRLSLCTQGKLTERKQSLPTDNLEHVSLLSGDNTAGQHKSEELLKPLPK